jgi:Protein of unknown function (DUF3592)
MPNLNLPLALLLFSSTGAMLLGYAGRQWRRVLLARRLPLIDAVIVKNEMLELHEPMAGNDDKLYQPKITFSAYVGGHKVISNTLCPDPDAYKFMNVLHAIASVNQYAAGTLVQARLVNESEPALMLVADVDRNRKLHYLAWAAFGVLVWLAMVPMVLTAWS